LSSVSKKIDKNGSAWYSFLLCEGWLGFRLDLLSATLVTFVVFFSVILVDKIDASLIGFTLMYTDM
jgi:hypothetical protein